MCTYWYYFIYPSLQPSFPQLTHLLLPFPPPSPPPQNPQYLLKIDKSKTSSSSSSVWLLLSRHVTQSRDELGESFSASNDDSSNSGGDYLTLHAYKSDSEKSKSNPARCRIIYPAEDCFVRGLYSNNPHNLVRFDVEISDPGTYALVLSQYEKKRDVRYSLTVLSTAPFSLQPTPLLPPVVARMEGTWGGETAGGRLGLATFLHNPQWTVVVTKACAVYVEMMAPKKYFVGFSLLGGLRGGKRVDSILQVCGAGRGREEGREEEGLQLGTQTDLAVILSFIFLLYLPTSLLSIPKTQREKKF